MAYAGGHKTRLGVVTDSVEKTNFNTNPILNSPYEYPERHWEMDSDNLPTSKVLEYRRPSSLKSPIAVAKRKSSSLQQGNLFAETEDGIDYATNDFINAIRDKVDAWRKLPAERWGVTPETARLLKWWRTA